jgi:hypothetical protein
VIPHLRAQHVAAVINPRQIDSEISYAGDASGIVFVPEEGRDMIIVSLTHVRMHLPRRTTARFLVAILLLSTFPPACPFTDTLTSTSNFFDKPTGFFLVAPVVDSKGMPVAYGAAKSSANWSITQWGIPNGQVPAFTRTITDDGATNHTQDGNLEVTVKEQQGAVTSFALSQNGTGLACVPDPNSEYAIFASPNANDFAPNYPSARRSDNDRSIVTALSNIKSVIMDADVMITNFWRDRTPACNVNQRALDISVVFNNYGDDARPSQTLFYDITPYLTRCNASDGAQACDSPYQQGVKYFYFDGAGANVSRDVSGKITHQNFGYHDLITSYDQPYMTPLNEQKYAIDLLQHVKDVIAQGSNGMDHDLSHWHLVGIYGGSHIWGNVGISSQWKNLSVFVQ